MRYGKWKNPSAFPENISSKKGGLSCQSPMNHKPSMLGTQNINFYKESAAAVIY